MNREKQIISNNLLQHLPEVDKALDILAAFSVTTYAMLVLQEKLFDPELSAKLYGKVENRSDFLAGANAVLQTLNDIPEALNAVRKELEQRK